MGNSLGIAALGRSDTEAATMGGKPWAIAWEEVCWEGTRWKRQEGGRRRNRGKYSLGRAPWGRSEVEATTGWTEGKPWEIDWGELRGEGATRGWTEGKPGNRGK